MLLLPPILAARESEPHKVRLGDVTTVEGVRDNLLIGYGMVAGLKGTGDSQQTVFSVQTLANLMQKMGVQFSASAVVVKNVAAVFVTATLPPFARPGRRLTSPFPRWATPRASTAECCFSPRCTVPTARCGRRRKGLW